MKRAPGALAVLATLLLVFSPLAASLLGSGVSTTALALSSDERRVLLAHVELALVAGAVALLLGAPFAILVAGTRSPLRKLFLALGALTLAVPHYLAAEALIDLVGPAGRLTRVFAGVTGAPVDAEQARLAVYRFAGVVYTAPAAGLVLGACLFPLVALAVATADRRFDARTREAARLARGKLGAALVAARALAPPALGAAALVFALALTEFAVPQTLRVRTLGEDVFAHIEDGDRPGAAAFGLVLVACALGAGILGALLLTRRRVASTAPLEGDVPRYELRPSRPIVGTLAGLLAVLPGFLCPLASLTLQASARIPGVASGSSGFGVALARAWQTCQGDALRTVGAAALAATVALLLATVAGHALRSPSRPAALLVGAVACGLAVPSPLVGLGLIVLWNHAVTAWVYDGTTVVTLGWLARFLPVALLLARTAFARVPSELDAAAALMGRGSAERFARVALPLAAPGLVAGWLAFYVLAATEFAATQVVLAPGKPLLAPTVVNLVHYGQDAGIAASGLILVATVVLPLLPLSLLLLVRSTWRS
jgi:iron(III) transport system permease protein